MTGKVVYNPYLPKPHQCVIGEEVFSYKKGTLWKCDTCGTIWIYKKKTNILEYHSPRWYKAKKREITKRIGKFDPSDDNSRVK